MNLIKELNIPNVIDQDSLSNYNQDIKESMKTQEINSEKEEIEFNLKSALILNITLLINSLKKEIKIERCLINNIKDIIKIIYDLKEEKKEKKVDKFSEKRKKEKKDLLNRKVTNEMAKNKIIKYSRKKENNPRRKNATRVKKLYEKGKETYDGCIDDKRSRSAKFQ